MSEKIKLDDKIVKDHISDWSYETKDDLGNKVIKQKGDRGQQIIFLIFIAIN